ncbi:MAG: CDP-alcohol phosphatidyltransferase family protein [Bacteroidetes bacterium]|nr:CDP-alcohol phosphatidyltransferase family protein [Bacteroidota bacterium]
MKNGKLYIFINGITLYRLIAAPILIILVIAGKPDVFKWLLLISFLTDAVDGFFARKYKITSAFGARIDSLADDGTILAAIVGLCVLRSQFILDEIVPVSFLFVLYAAQNILAFSKYKRTTSFHTYAAKAAAVSQAIFLLAFFFMPNPVYWLFFLMVALTSIDLLEEIILVVILPDYRINVKGLYWILTEKAGKQDTVD